MPALRTTLIFFMAMLLPLLSHAATPYREKCLSYWVVGDSGCDGAEPVSQTVDDVLPEPIVDNQQPQAPELPPEPKAPTLDEKIEDFMENHGKPPREFVAFHLEPTIENALKWVQKYEEMLTRNRRLAGAWNQARILYEEAKEKGVKDKLPQLENPLPEVPNFGVQLPAEMSWFMQEDQVSKIDQGSPFSVFGGPFSEVGGAVNTGVTPLGQDGSIGGRSEQVGGVSSGVTPLVNGRIGGGPEKAYDGPIQISYYFSAECPYCKEFEPELDKVIKSMHDRLEVTCVDMTPSGSDKMNIHGKVDCAWRPVRPGEASRFGIVTTPSLIVKRSPEKPMERINGYVDSERLEAFLREGVTD